MSVIHGLGGAVVHMFAEARATMQVHLQCFLLKCVKAPSFRNSYFKGNRLKCLLFRILRGKGKKNIGLFQTISIGIHTWNQQII